MSDPTGDLRAALEAFIAASDARQVGAIAGWYADDFVCQRVPDAGTAVILPRALMLDIFARNAAPQAPASETFVDSVDIIDGLGFTLLRRIKDVGQGEETMFYCLVWRQDARGWRLVREYVHQRALPPQR